MSEVKRLLCIVGGMDAGGAETFLMKIYRNIDRTKYQMDFCVAKKEKNFYEDEIIKLGGKIYRITPKTKSPIKNWRDIKRIVKDNNYKIVLRTSQSSVSSLELLAAKRGGADQLVFRSSNSNSCGGVVGQVAHIMFRPIANKISTVKIAPSTEAGRYMFGKNKYSIIKNGIDFNEYKYSEKNRNKYRKLYGIDESITVIGHVGRFTKQKNHLFLLDIFKEYQKYNNKSELWLVGKGDLENEIKEHAKNLNIYTNIRFLGVRNDVSKIYSAFDYFVFPSIYEGLPNTIIEAQASGLTCIMSDSVTKECKINNNVSFVSLSLSPEVWAKKIINAPKRGQIKDEMFGNYNINTVTNYFMEQIFEGKQER